ncbi:hypothetical protein [Antrihabitans cavernicola]|uniref:Uncharacterized protein n=1 Tax=Antrihabitans cavernicola TaxID=2495913 RepID=A0A5A7S8W9_9NOCA|nr:hypothetical protein [Spelaeibacter cavernicola]KAA0022366.1 hypothetical protein FOY51_15485 [Spelaeibacter cavernicola]
MTTELGPQRGQCIPVDSEADLSAWSKSLETDATVLRLREEAMVGSNEATIGVTYRWLEFGAALAHAPLPVGRMSGADAMMTLARHFEVASKATDFLQVDDLWQALRQRELLVWSAGHDSELLGVSEREHWEHATQLWRGLPLQLMRARMRAESGKKVDTALIVDTLEALSEYEGKHLTSVPETVWDGRV